MLGGHKSALCASVALATFCATAASAQEAGKPDRPDSEIVVVGERGSAVTDIMPIATLDVGAIQATGATTMPELLRAIRGQTQSADGSEPIFLLNAQRVSGYQEIGTLPPEAILRVEVLPEPAALRFGYPPTRRVVNFITKPDFHQTEIRLRAGTTTRAGSGTGNANLGITRLRGGGRMTLNLEARHTDALAQTDRSIIPDPDVPFDIVGNIVGVGGQIDPALSAAAGHPVTIAGVPASPSSLAAYANSPARVTDLSPYRTLAPRNDAVKAEAVFANRVGKTLAGSISLSAERSRDRSILGPADAMLVVPASNPFSPFANTVLLDRYLIEAPLLRQNQTVTTLHAGALLRGAISGWRWDLSAAVDQKQTDGFNERGIDPAAANAAIAAGANPFASLDAASLTNRLTDRTRVRTRTTEIKAVATNTPIHLPAGKVTVTGTVEAGTLASDSANRGAVPSARHLARSRTESTIAVDVPLTSRRDNVLPFVGDLSASASYTARTVGGFGALHDSTWGLNWSPIERVQLLATIKHSAAAPDPEMQLTPVATIPNATVFDFSTGHTEITTLILGGNPDLLAERRLVRSLTLSVKPFAKRELRVSISYDTTTIRDQTGTVYALTPQTEAILPDLFKRDASGHLSSVAYRPINFSLERTRTLGMTLNAYGPLGRKPPPAGPPKPGSPPAQPAPRPTYWAGLGPSIKFSDMLQLRPGSLILDVLHGDTVTGGGNPHAYGYAYGGFNYLGNGANFDFWVGGGNRVRSPNPASDLRFSPIFKLNMNAYISVHHFLKHAAWTSHTQLRLEVSNVTNAHQRVRDGNGNTPNRLQRDYLDPIGRTISLSLRKTF
jgi:hypothetical protein